MNVFVLDSDFKLSASYHVDKHVGKLAMEASQLLSNAHHRYNPTPKKLPGLCRPSHMNHPWSVWARTSRANYEWLLMYYVALHDEFMYRFDKVHGNYTNRYKSVRVIPKLLTGNDLTPMPLCMPDQYKDRDSVVNSYRNYYRGGKIHLHDWTRRSKPDWM